MWSKVGYLVFDPQQSFDGCGSLWVSLYQLSLRFTAFQSILLSRACRLHILESPLIWIDLYVLLKKEKKEKAFCQGCSHVDFQREMPKMWMQRPRAETLMVVAWSLYHLEERSHVLHPMHTASKMQTFYNFFPIF